MCCSLPSNSARAAGTDFPDDLLNVMRHLVLAHHGTHEFGSPKLPMTAEAFAIHHLDNLDAKTTIATCARRTAGANRMAAVDATAAAVRTTPGAPNVLRRGIRIRRWPITT